MPDLSAADCDDLSEEDQVHDGDPADYDSQDSGFESQLDGSHISHDDSRPENKEFYDDQKKDPGGPGKGMGAAEEEKTDKDQNVYANQENEKAQ